VAIAIAAAGERGVGFISLGGFLALVGLGMLVTGSASINDGCIVLSRREARIFGAATMVLGLVMVSIGILARTERFEGSEIAIGVFFVFFVAVQLVGWARAGEGSGKVRRRALIVGFVLVFQLAFLIFVGIMFTTL
jgi:hypothetical protein